MQVYRDGDLTLDQLMAFAITEDHARQEQVFDNLSYNRDAFSIRRELTRTHIAAQDRRALFIGAQAYIEAGGMIIRDLFTDDRGGFYDDAALLDQMVIEKLVGVAQAVREAEGWRWVDAHIDYPHAHGLRRVYPQPVALSQDNEAAYLASLDAFNKLTEDWQGAEELPDDVDKRFGELEAEIERIEALRQAYAPDVVARGGAFVMLSHDGTARIERGFIRPEDDQPAGDAQERGETCAIAGGGDIIHDPIGPDGGGDSDEAEDADKPLSDLLVRDLTAHRTLGLRLALGEQPVVALVAVTHTLAAQTFYQAMEAHCLEIRSTSTHLAGHADGIEDTAAARALADRHAAWAADMPGEVAELWSFIASLDHASLMALFAHCASLTVNAVRQPWERKPRAHQTADKLATAVSLDMSTHWRPTVRSYLGRVTKANILAAVCEAMGEEPANRLTTLKKQPMAQAAEQMLASSGWLPALMRTTEPVTLTLGIADTAAADVDRACVADVAPVEEPGFIAARSRSAETGEATDTAAA